MGPYGKPEIAGDGLELGEPVGSRRYVAGEPGRAAATPSRAGHQESQGQPCRREAHVEPPALTPGHPESSGHKRPIVEQDQKRSRHDHLLRAHAEQAGGDGADLPPEGPGRFDRPQEAVECQQVEQSRQRFDPLDDIGHRLRLQRMQGPQQRGRQRQGEGIPREAPAQGGTPQGPPQDAEKRHAPEDVHQQVERVIAPDVRAAERKVDGKREIGDRAAGDRRPRRRRKRAPDGPQCPYARVVQGRRPVIKDERGPQGITVCRESRESDDHDRRNRLRAARCRKGVVRRSRLSHACEAPVGFRQQWVRSLRVVIGRSGGGTQSGSRRAGNQHH